jgi:heptosyltransferase II
MNKRSLMLTRRTPEQKNGLQSTVEHYLHILDELNVRRTMETPVLKVTQHEEERFDEEHLGIAGDYVVFITGAQYGPAKRWPDSHFSELADLITDRYPVNVLLLPGKGEEAIAKNVVQGARNSDRIHIESMDVRDMKVCMSRANLVVSNDTGPRHIAAALSIPTAVILGPMDERYTGYPSRVTRTVCKDIPCRPCNKRRCNRDHECLKGITPSEVLTAVEEGLSERLARSS